VRGVTSLGANVEYRQKRGCKQAHYKDHSLVV